MSLTITLTPALIGVVVYAVGFLVTAAAFVSDEMSFKNPSYWAALAAAAVWPLIVLQVTILARLDIYLGDIVRDMKDWYDQKKCSHDTISECGDYEVNGRVGDEICHDCGKVWWEQ